MPQFKQDASPISEPYQQGLYQFYNSSYRAFSISKLYRQVLYYVTTLATRSMLCYNSADRASTIRQLYVHGLYHVLALATGPLPSANHTNRASAIPQHHQKGSCFVSALFTRDFTLSQFKHQKTCHSKITMENTA